MGIGSGPRLLCQGSRAGETRTDSRGKRVMDMVSRLRLVVLKNDTMSTFRRPGNSETSSDVPLAKEHQAARISDWHVIEDYTGSDHQCIMFRLRDAQPGGVQRKCAPPRWIIAKLDRMKLSLALEHGQMPPSRISDALPDAAGANLVTEPTMKLLQWAYGAAEPKVRANRKRYSAYWRTRRSWSRDAHASPR